MALRATEALYIGWARAHNPGDIVDSERVEQYGWGDKVEKVADAKAKTNGDKSKSA